MGWLEMKPPLRQIRRAVILYKQKQGSEHIAYTEIDGRSMPSPTLHYFRNSKIGSCTYPNLPDLYTDAASEFKIKPLQIIESFFRSIDAI